MTGMRTTDLLASVGPITVVGTGRAALTAAEILGVLGAAISKMPVQITAERVRAYDDCPLVIADVVSSGAEPGYAAAVASRTQGVWVTVSAFGLDGPLGGRAGSDLVCAAAGGLLRAVCDTSGRIYSLPNEQALQLAGQAAALGVLHGVSLNEGSRGPLHLDVSGQEAVAFNSVQQECAHLLYRCGGSGGSRRYSAPSGVFSCRDGQIGLIVIDDHQWQRACNVLGEPTWPELYPLATDRQAHQEEINSRVEQWLADKSKSNAEQTLQAAGLAAVAIRKPGELRDSEQFRYRRFLRPTVDGSLRTELLPAEVVPMADSDHEPRLGRTLEGMRVAEVTNVLAGPLAGAILGAMGAEVVRLEETTRLDVYRRNGPFQDGRPGPERAAYFLFANYSKRSGSRRVGADDSFGTDVLNWAHLVLENVGSTRLDRLGLEAIPGGDHSVIAISGFGRSGPAADYRAYAPNVHAYSGIAGAVQEGVSEDITIWSSFADYCAAVWAATVAAAWWIGGTSGRHFDLSMAEVMAAKLNRLSLDTTPVTVDSHEILIRCGEDDVAVSASEQDYAKLLDAFPLKTTGAEASVGVARARLVDEPSFLNGAEFVDALAGAGFKVSLAKGATEILADEQLDARGFVVDLPHPEVGRAPVFALPWKPFGQPREGYRRAPLLGEDDEWLDCQLAMNWSATK